MSKLYGKNAVKVGDVLVGYHCRNRKGVETYKEFKVAKVGRKYLYDANNRTIKNSYDVRWVPQWDDLIAVGQRDYCGDYKFYKTLKAAEIAREAYLLAIQLNSFNFRQLTDREIFRIAEICRLEQGMNDAD